MPTYEYACTGCGHTFETRHSITVPPLLARHAVMVRICGRRVFYSVGEGVVS